jgi:hypothetical protein
MNLGLAGLFLLQSTLPSDTTKQEQLDSLVALRDSVIQIVLNEGELSLPPLSINYEGAIRSVPGICKTVQEKEKNTREFISVHLCKDVLSERELLMAIRREFDSFGTLRSIMFGDWDLDSQVDICYGRVLRRGRPDYTREDELFEGEDCKPFYYHFLRRFKDFHDKRYPGKLRKTNF